ncbi:hypothetical protein BGZ83_001058 [Gryganskiella cystojenkinii]|nr:hypothetical protein BGZ83_001058 [Gryganskiella cystojenkinii]
MVPMRPLVGYELCPDRDEIRQVVLDARLNSKYSAPTQLKVVNPALYVEDEASETDSTQEGGLCTLSMAGLTQSLEETNSCSQSDLGYMPKDPRQTTGNILPDVYARPSQDLSTDMGAATLPYDQLLPGISDEPSQDPAMDSHGGAIQSRTRSPTRRSHATTAPMSSSMRSSAQRPPSMFNNDRDAPTQLLVDMPTQPLFDSDAATQLVPSALLLQDSEAPTQPIHIHAHTANQSYDRDAPTQLVNNPLTQLLVDPDAPTQVISNSVLADVVVATQSTVQNDPSQRDDRSQTHSYSRDAPTLAYDPNEPTQLADTSHQSLPFDPDAPTQFLEVNLTSRSGDSSLSSVLGPPSFEKNVNAVDVIEATQPLAIQGSSLDSVQDGPLSANIEVPDSLPDIIHSTQPTQTKEPASTPSNPHSRQGSTEPVSPEPSQVFMTAVTQRRLSQRHVDAFRIPSTPIDDINQTESSPPPGSTTGHMGDDISEGTDLRESEEHDIVESTQMPEYLMHLDHPQEEDTPRESSVDSIMGSRRSNSSRAASPKHSLENDSGDENPQKPSKHVKRETTEEPSSSLLTRAPGRGSLQRRATMDLDTHKVLLSAPQWTESEKKHLSDVVVRLGGSITDDIKKGSILILDSSLRTAKFMCAIVRGITIVSVGWIKASETLGRFAPWEDHIFHDEAMEKNFDFDLQETCRRAQENRENRIELFDGDTFYFITVASKSKDSIPEGFLTRQYVRANLVPMVEVCGGKVVQKLPKQQSPEGNRHHMFIVGPDGYCEEAQDFIQNGFTVVRKEFILSTILKQTVDFKPHLIPKSSGPDEEAPDTEMRDEIDDFDESDDSDAAPGTKGSSKLTRGSISTSKSSGGKEPQRSSRSSRAGSTVSNQTAAEDSEASSSYAVASPALKTGRSRTTSSSSVSKTKASTATATVGSATPSLRRSQSTKGSTIAKGRSRSKSFTVDAMDESDTPDAETGVGSSSRTTTTARGKGSLTKSTSTVHQQQPQQATSKPKRSTSTVSGTTGKGSSAGASTSKRKTSRH